MSHPFEEEMLKTRRQEFQTILDRVAKLPRPKLAYDQLPAFEFMRLQFFHRLLTHQSAYMLLVRSLAMLSGLGWFPEKVLRPEGLTDPEVIAWSNRLTVKTLFEAYCTYPDHALVAFIADIHMEGWHLDEEWARRFEDKPLTQELIRLDWGGENRVKMIERFLQVDKIKGYTSNPQEDGDDLRSTAWEKALDVWQSPGPTPLTAEPLPPFPFRPEAMLPNERAFWEGPLAVAWESAQAAVLRNAVPVLEGERESIPDKVRNHIREGWRKRDRQSLLLSRADTLRGERQEIEEKKLDRRPARPVRVVHAEPSPGADARIASRERIAPLYQLMEERHGEKGRRYLDGLMAGDTYEEAAARAGVSRKTGHKWRFEIEKTLPQKKSN